MASAIADPPSRGVLRFITAGSVDDGKSTLIGRLLFDGSALATDQLAALQRHATRRQEADLDLSLLTDGLESEREQGITIDIAYRYFASPRRKFIVADAPGHERYTRNMVTGASTADAIVLLIDATKVVIADGEATLLPQTKRHSIIADLLALRHVIVVVNKMDLVAFDEGRFDAICSAYRRFAAGLHLPTLHFVPISARMGENVVHGSDRMPWYRGPSLLTLLESLPAGDEALTAAFRFPVQLVARHDGHARVDFRGYMGRVEAGSVRVGDPVVILPSGDTTVVKAIAGGDGPLATAGAGQSVTLLLEDQIDISRGDLIAAAGVPPQVGQSIAADLCWLGSEPWQQNRRYLLRQGTRTVPARIATLDYKLDVIELAHREGDIALRMNDIGRVAIRTQQPLAWDRYRDVKATGAFILIDEVSNDTVAAGLIR